MSNALPTTATRRLLEGARYEVLPTATIADKIYAAVPKDITLTVTASPAKGLSGTLDLAEQLAREGYDVVPHLAARMISGPDELRDIVARVSEVGIRKVFVPAGDAPEPAGEFHASIDLLEALTAMGRPFEHVGITGYPESHPTIDDDVTIQAMWEKRRHATHVVSNMTFDAEAVALWIERMRRRGMNLPVLVGVPGPVEPTKLLGMATKIGVGESIRFLKKQRKVFARIATPGFTTDKFVARVAALSANDSLAVAGLHLYTFNQVDVVESWRRRTLDELSTLTT
ncbi:methylenetetrahydrofolate reductase [Agilicoccus flavus]|uniref:methylenetetrahydrofolate reductase n=1 Tax=Agilicoccus flavus TaxID=2775968 RepID=UPI001CF6F68A|nr:methylenetetrahydrofolate reductase [Agilicoccus flavus]